MTMDEVRQFLLDNPQYYSDKNDTKIENIKSQNKYYFIADCKHEFYSLPKNVIKDYKLLCPVCTGRQVVRGINDIWAVDPDLAKSLLNSEDGYKYTIKSNKKLQWQCENCGNISLKSPAKMKENISKCQYCNKITSYGENFITEMLFQLCESFEPEKEFDWSDGKRYDFYLPLHSCIIEVHGKQHYSNNDFSKLSGKTYIEEQLNDTYKEENAKKNGIKHYIVIDNRISDEERLTENILKSLLPTILNFKKEDVDWNKCHEFCMTNKTIDICKFYKNDSKDFKIIADNFGCCINTVKKHLKDGAKLGWCDYTPEKGREYGKEKTRERVVKEMSKSVIQFDLYGNFIKEFPGIQQAQRELGIHHICECLVGKRKTSGGFQWRYSNDCDNVSAVVYKKSGKPYKEVNQYDKQMNLIKTWFSISDAAKSLGINARNIISVCQKRQKTSGGFIWRYKVEDDNDRKN